MADVAASDVTYTVAQQDIIQRSREGRKVSGSISVGNGTLTYDPSTGIPLTKGKLSGYFEIKDFIVTYVNSSTAGIQVRFDRDNQLLRIYDGAGPHGLASITVQDDDCAASNGTAVYVLDQLASPAAGVGKYLTGLLSANANNADATIQFGANGPTAVVEDDDCAASNGVQLFLDEDDNKFIAAIAQDLYLPLSDGSFLKIYADASASCNGVAVYFDDNGANAYERFLAVTAGNADDTVTQELGNGEICPTLNLDFVAHVS